MPVSVLIALMGWGSCLMLLPSGRVHIGGLLLYALIGYLLVVLNNTFALIRLRASVQTSAYLLLTAACPVLHVWWTSDLAAAALLLSIYFLFRSYQRQHPSGDVFHAFLFLGLGSLGMPELTWLAPLLWVGAYRFQSLSARSFVASLLGWSVPYWLLFAYAYCCDDMELFYTPFRKLVVAEPFFEGFEPWLLVTGGYLLLLFVVSAVHCTTSGNEDKLRTRNFMNFLVLLCGALFVWLLLQPLMGIRLLALLLPCLSVLSGHFFILTHSRTSNIFFLAMFLLLLPLFLFNLWTLL